MKGKSNFVHWQIVLFLVSLIICNTYFGTLALQDRRAQAARIEEHAERVQALLDRQQWIVAGAADSYRADAYAPGIERIAEQQLIAAEYQMLLLQAIAQQNALMIELMTVEP